MDRFGGLLFPLAGWPCWIVLLTFIFCLRLPFLITLMYKLDRNVHVSHPLSLYQGGKNPNSFGVSNFFFLWPLALVLIRLLSVQPSFCLHHAFKPARIVLDLICRVRENFSLPPFLGGWVRRSKTFINKF